jgi:hypothetical protein
LILERFLAACTWFLHKVRARRTGLGVFVALVLNLLVTAGWAAGAFVVAWWRASATGLRRMQDCSSTGTSDFFKYCFETARTWPFVAERWTGVVSAFQWTATNSDADVLGLDILFCCHTAILAFCDLPFAGFLFSRTAALSAFVSTAIQSRAADSGAGWWFFSALMTYTVRCGSATTTRDLCHLQTWSAISIVAYLLAEMSTWKQLLTFLLAVRYRYRAIESRLREQNFERSLPARAIGDHIRRERAMSRFRLLRMAFLLAEMIRVATVKWPMTLSPTIK